MKLKSAAGLVCYVKDLPKTIAFYEALGFVFTEKNKDHAKCYLNWYWIDFVVASGETKKEFLEEAKASQKGAGMYMYFSVDDVGAAYKELVQKGFKPSSEPHDWPWGNREFDIRDPDGYKIVLFKKK